MTDNNSSNGLTTCSIVCWLLAFALGIFVAAALIHWVSIHGLLAAVIGLIAMLLAGWILKGMFCADDASSTVSSTTAAAAVGAGAVATATAATSAAAEKPAAKKAAPAKKTAAKSTSTAKTKTAAAKKPAAAKAAPKAKAAAKPATAKKPAAKKAAPAKKTAAKSTSTAKTKTAAAKKPVAAKAAPKAKAAAKPAAAKKASPAKFYTKAPAKVDDLKLISGVGPKLEKTLNDIGVYKYEQVAVWKKADIKKVDDQLKFKGRIERDNWMKQAKVLAKGGDTEFSKKKRK
ncbi:NADH:quinone oxidoreductase [Amylibacter sp. SFDW26]|uniref:NADH:quinone oxidoreductase n=1 Tax=Amylibacter sp. SFDW26 TaxID=2652722 RepID=UPI0012622FB5|nr:NADH:quinone oxidoreductase [Amylibacter sp. SFDW26]KAB7616289.1 NADH:quinone oxidoreductase [Amylibacter sp. SFDW26]